MEDAEESKRVSGFNVRDVVIHEDYLLGIDSISFQEELKEPWIWFQELVSPDNSTPLNQRKKLKCLSAIGESLN